MRLRRLTIRLLIVASIACAASLAYFAYGRHRVSSLEAACKAAHESQQWAQLESLATQWVQWQPENALPWLYAAEAANQQGEEIRTASYLYHLPNNDPRSPPALLELSHLQFGKLNQPIAAAQTCQRILQIQPDASEAHRRLVFFYAMSRQRAKLIEETRRAIAVGCDVPETYLYLIGADWITFTNGAELNERWLQAHPGNEDFLVARAFHQVRTAALDESSDERDADGTSKSERIMADMLERFPNNVEILAYHLDLACFRGNEDRVTELLAQAPPESADDSRFWRYKGWVHESRREFDEAEEAYLHALELHPFDGQAQHNLAGVYRRKQDLQRVDQFQQLAVLGKEVMRECLQAPTSQSLPNELLDKMRRYADQCGDTAVAQRLQERINQPR